MFSVLGEIVISGQIASLTLSKLKIMSQELSSFVTNDKQGAMSLLFEWQDETQKQIMKETEHNTNVHRLIPVKQKETSNQNANTGGKATIINFTTQVQTARLHIASEDYLISRN